MSDFGANIFDDEPKHRSEPPPPKNPPAAAPPSPPPSQAPRPLATPANAPQQQARPAPPGPPREGRREPAPPRATEPDRGPGRGPERHTAFRPSAPPAPSAADRPGQGSERVPPRQPQRAGIAVLVDLDALQAEARAQRGELAMQRLRNGLGGERTVQRAVAFAATNVTPPNGFELQVASAGPGLGDGVRFAAAALELLAAAGALVLAPASATNQQLAKALRAAGHAVDLAGFDAGAASGERTRKLGRDCLFVP